MLAADKLQLQSALKQQATALKEKEFNLHVSNMSEFYIFIVRSFLLIMVASILSLRLSLSLLLMCRLYALRLLYYNI